MRIAVVVCAYPPYRGGIGNAAARQARALADGGHEVVVLCPAHATIPGSEREADGIEVRRLRPLLTHGVSAFLPSVFAHTADVDAIYLHYPFFGGAEAALLSAWLRRKPLVVYFHMDVLGQGAKRLFLDGYAATIGRAVFGTARLVLASSLDYAHHASIGRLRLPQLRALPFSIDTDRFVPAPSDEAMLANFGLDPAVPTVLFVGGMDAGHAFKGVPVLIEAMARFDRGEAQLLLVGDGELRSGFERLAAERCSIAYAFAGGADDAVLRRCYQSAAVTVLPSTTAEEAFGIVLIESMACGTPVIASDLAGVRTVVTDDVGALVPPGDAAALASAIRFLVHDEFGLSARRRTARVRALAHYSRKRESADLLQAFAALPMPGAASAR